MWPVMRSSMRPASLSFSSSASRISNTRSPALRPATKSWFSACSWPDRLVKAPEQQEHHGQLAELDFLR